MQNTTKPELTLPAKLRGLIPHLKFSKGTHTDWREWLEKNPDDARLKDVGGVAHHLECEDEYSRRIEFVIEAANRIEQLEALTQWQPIETAPKGDGLVDLWVDKYKMRVPDCYFQPNIGKWFCENGGRWETVKGEPTHFMYPPKSPGDV